MLGLSVTEGGDISPRPGTGNRSNPWALSGHVKLCSWGMCAKSAKPMLRASNERLTWHAKKIGDSLSQLQELTSALINARVDPARLRKSDTASACASATLAVISLARPRPYHGNALCTTSLMIGVVVSEPPQGGARDCSYAVGSMWRTCSITLQATNARAASSAWRSKSAVLCSNA